MVASAGDVVAAFGCGVVVVDVLSGAGADVVEVSWVVAETSVDVVGATPDATASSPSGVHAAHVSATRPTNTVDHFIAVGLTARHRGSGRRYLQAQTAAHPASFTALVPAR